QLTLNRTIIGFAGVVVKYPKGLEEVIMGFQVCMGAMLQCSFGTAPSALSVLPANRVVGATPAANIMDNIPMLNIMPFGQCSSMSNPMVAAATAAASGALTPVPCIPVTTAPW